MDAVTEAEWTTLVQSIGLKDRELALLKDRPETLS